MRAGEPEALESLQLAHRRGFLVRNRPGISAACGEELGLIVTVVGVGLAQTAIMFVTGYLRRNEAST